jgi:hypothetical protein
MWSSFPIDRGWRLLSWDILTEISFQASLGFDRGSLFFQRFSAANVLVTQFAG